MSIQPDNRFVDTEPWIDDADISAPERAEMDAPGWLLTWRKFRRHKLALVSGVFLVAVLPDAARRRLHRALYAQRTQRRLSLCPTAKHQPVARGIFVGPYVYPVTAKADLVNFRWTYTTDETRPCRWNFSARATSTTSLA